MARASLRLPLTTDARSSSTYRDMKVSHHSFSSPTFYSNLPPSDSDSENWTSARLDSPAIMSSTPDSIVLPTPLAPEESEEQSNEELGTEESHVEELQAEEPQAEEHQSEEPRTEEPQAGEHQAQQDGVAHAESPTIEASKSTAYRRRLLETVVDLHESGKRPSKDSEIEVLRKSVLVGPIKM